jgi:uncharacterized membrane protein SpoIIM required for sporulation
MSMNEKQFTERHSPSWQELEGVLQRLEKGEQSNQEAVRVPLLFRQVAADLSLAQHRMLGSRLSGSLNMLVTRCFALMHRGLSSRGGLWEFVTQIFPRTVRGEWRLALIGFCLFMIPFIAMIMSAKESPQYFYSALSTEEIAAMDDMYGDSAKSVEETEAEGPEILRSFAGFAFYVEHNIGIGLKSYGLGALGTVGAVYELVWEGVKLGAMFGYVHSIGNGHKIWQFAISHSSFELLGLILCATGGVRLGLGLILPGRKTRSASLRDSAKQSLPLLFGGVFMVFVAAIIEGFWSHQPAIPADVKYAFGTSAWVFWLLYFAFAGRVRHAG